MGYTDFKAFAFKLTKDVKMEVDNNLHVGPMDRIARIL